MPSWGILSKKKSRKGTSSAHTVHFNITADAGHESDSKSRSSSVPSEASDHLFHLHYQHEVCNGDAHHHDLQHDDEEDEEERECLKHLDHLSLALENTFKEVESIDAFVNKLRQEFQHEEMSEKRFMSCICSARIARAACCKKQIEVWRQLQHDIQEFCCHHHPHEEEEELNQHSDDCPALHHELTYDSDSSLCSHDAADVDFVVCRLNKMVLFDLVKHRLDPMADTRSFVEHWIMKGSQGDDHCLASS